MVKDYTEIAMKGSTIRRLGTRLKPRLSSPGPFEVLFGNSIPYPSDPITVRWSPLRSSYSGFCFRSCVWCVTSPKYFGYHSYTVKKLLKRIYRTKENIKVNTMPWRLIHYRSWTVNELIGVSWVLPVWLLTQFTFWWSTRIHPRWSFRSRPP